MEKKKCPYCAEEIMGNAIKCKHCGEFLKTEQKEDFESSEGGFLYYLLTKGRMSQSQYVLTLLITIGVAIIFIFIGATLEFPLLIVLTFVISNYISIVSGVKRLHDFNKSGYHIIWLYILGLFGILYLVLKSGDRKSNKYGSVA